MSIIGQAVVGAARQVIPPGELRLLVVLAVAAAAGLGVAAWAGACKRRSIVGPPRVEDGESVGPLVMILGGGFVLWIALQVSFIAPQAQQAASATAPTTREATTQVAAQSDTMNLTPERMAMVASVPGVIAGITMVIANMVLRPAGVRSLGLSPRLIPSGLKSGIVGAIVMIPLVMFVAQVTDLAWKLIHYSHPGEHDLLRVMGESQSGLVTAVLIGSAVLIAPVFEEILFRGHLQTVMTYAMGRARRGGRQGGRGFDVLTPVVAGWQPGIDLAAIHPVAPLVREAPPAWVRWIAVIAASLLFSAVHPAWTIPPIFVLSLCLGYAYERTGNLWTTITMHAAFNTFSTLLFLSMSR